MLGHGDEPKMGLGQNGNGIASLVEFIGNRRRFRLGYEPMHADMRRIALERRESSMGQPQGLQVEESPFVTSMKASSAWGGCAKDGFP